MKSIFIFLNCCLLFMFAALGNAQDSCQYEGEEITYIDNLTYYNDRLVNGVVCVYRNGQLVMEVPYKNGLREGLGRFYYDGKLIMEAPYKDGQTEGLLKIYSGISELFSEIPHKNGLKEGIARDYYEVGKIKREVLYKNNKKEGYEQEYTEDGQLYSKVLYKNDEAVSGVCGNGRVFTAEEVAKSRYFVINCD